MEKFLIILISAVVVMSLGACSSNRQTFETSEMDLKNNAGSSMTSVKPKPDTLIDTEYYTISAPNSWNDDCFYEIVDGENYNYTLSFYEKASYKANNGGWLFSINLLTEFEDYYNYPDYDVLGSLEVYRIGSYNIVVTYPTDVQYSEKTAKKYNEMRDDISGILDTISFKKECAFSDIPMPVETVEETNPQFSERFIGKWKDLGIGSRTPSGATRWNVEYRSDGTGTFEFVYEDNDIVTVNFIFSPFETYLGESTDGILIHIDGGSDIRYMAKYTWSNKLQKMLMTMYEVEDGGAPNLDVYWVFANV